METMKRQAALYAAAVLLGIWSMSLIQADVYVKQVRRTDAFEVMGQKQPEKVEWTGIWLSERRARVDIGEDSSWIILLDENLSYLLDHTRMTYREVPFGDLTDTMLSHVEGEVTEEQMEQAKGFMKGISAMMTPELEIEETAERQKIKEWNCHKYLLRMKMMGQTSVSEIWATEDIPIDYDLYRTLSSAMAAKQPGFQEMFEEMKKIKGIAVLTTSSSSAMGAIVKIKEEIEEVRQKPAPAGTYDIPDGYVKK